MFPVLRTKFIVSLNSYFLTAVWRSSVALPLKSDKVGKVVLQAHAGGGRVAPVVHLAALVDAVDGHAGAEEAAVAAVALVGEGVAARGALHHAPQLQRAPLAPLEVLHRRGEQPAAGDGCSLRMRADSQDYISIGTDILPCFRSVSLGVQQLLKDGILVQ